MFDHLTVGSNDLARAAAFYDAVLIPLGLRRWPVEPDGEPDVACWVGASGDLPMFFVSKPFDGAPARPGNGIMPAFLAPSPAAVDASYTAGIALGGTDEGAPGPREHYGPGYYGAYLRDLDGNKIHIVHRL